MRGGGEGEAYLNNRKLVGLTRRLLSFARRQPLEPRPIDMDRLVSGLAELIRCTVGPKIALDQADRPRVLSELSLPRPP
jgi:hypothetical protein